MNIYEWIPLTALALVIVGWAFLLVGWAFVLYWMARSGQSWDETQSWDELELEDAELFPYV